MLFISAIAIYAEGNSDIAYTNLSKTYVDSLVDRGFYLLNTASSMAGSDYSLQEAIGYGRDIVRKLKRQAETDVNKKYILFKVGELESQLYLEDAGMLQETGNRTQRAVNDLVGPFNGEIGRSRPDFTRLNSIWREMAAADGIKGDELGCLVRDRSRNITREVIYSIETAIDNKDFDLARRELAYCENNLAHLSIPITTYSRLMARLQARVTVDAEIVFIGTTVIAAESSLAAGDLGKAGSALSVAGTRLEQIKSSTVQKVWDQWYFKIKRLDRALERTEDSLVALTMNALENEGIVAAQEYLSGALVASGVNPEKIGKVDYAILETALTQRRPAAFGTASVSSDISETADNSADDSPINELLAAAKLKAKDKEAYKAMEKQPLRMTRTAEVKRDRLKVAQEGILEREQRMRELRVQQSREFLLQIYLLLEKRKADEAYKLFDRIRGELQDGLPEDEFVELVNTVSKEYEKWNKKKGKKR